MMENANGLFPELIIHPGETIKELLEEKNMTQEELAIRTGFSAKHISEVISGKKNISSKFANRLEYVFGLSTEFWINLQGIYDKEILEMENLNNVQQEEFDIIDQLKELIKYLEKINIIEHSNNKSLTVLNIRRFLNLNNLTSIPDLPLQQVSFRASKKNKINTYVLYTWQKLCEYLTDNINIVNSFDKNKLKEKYNQIKESMFLDANDMINELKKIFLDCGIVFEVVKHFTGAPVQGFIQKKDKKVLLCMTIRQSFSDIFWFTLFHEIGHLINEDFKDTYIDYTIIDSPSEQKADEFAKNILICEEDYQQFILKGQYKYHDIEIFAKSQNVLPGIIIGRIQNDKKDYSFLANYKEQYKWST